MKIASVHNCRTWILNRLSPGCVKLTKLDVFSYLYFHKLDVYARVRHFPAIIVFVKTSFLLPDCLDTVMKEHENKKRMPMYQTTTRVMRTNEERGDSSWEWHIQTYGAASDGWQKQQLGSSNWSHVWYQAHSSFSKCEDCFLSWFNLAGKNRLPQGHEQTRSRPPVCSDALPLNSPGEQHAYFFLFAAVRISVFVQ